MKIDKYSRFKTHKEFVKEALENTALKKEYDSLEPEYRLASLIIEARLTNNLTQEELARKAGLNQATIARLESGTNNPTVSTVNRVALALGKKLTLV